MFPKVYKNTLTLALSSVAVGFLFLSGIASAVSPTISKAFIAEQSISNGGIVRLVPGTKNTVTSANIEDTKDLVGVKEPSNGSLLEINPSNSTVQIAVSGTVDTLVSTINGNIKQGDYVAVSPFGGMGMESSPGDYSIGIASSNFNSKAAGATEQTVTNKSGHSVRVWAGEIPVTISIGIDNASDSNNLNSLQHLASSITGHTISTGRIIAALVLAVLAFATLVTLTYSATYGSIISIGRNPLAKYEILKGVRSIVIALVGIAIVSSLLIYLLLS